ncbi:MAG: hypothetical protein J6W86_07690 [Bacteroidales bacterium]|nr:hypothetical protein [Bacteroidales bacterium]MBP5693572.1 hypothetical protein [Bacteroidales bacterium]
MEDLLIREIDRIGEMMLKIAQRLGLFSKSLPNYTLDDIKAESEKIELPFSIEKVLEQDNPVLYLVEKEKISDNALETFVDILFHSDMEETRKNSILDDAVTYLDSKGNFSFRLHSYK